MQIRPPRQDELRHCQEIEKAAGAVFRATPFAHIADYEPMSLRELELSRRQDTLWVAAGQDGDPHGFLLAEEIPEGLYIHEISVHPDWQRRGLARQLIDHAARVAANGDMGALWLRTFRDIDWNRPLYERFGFQIVGDDQPASLAADLIAYEASLGLSGAVRCTMRRPVFPA